MCELGDQGHAPNQDGLECKASLLARSPGDRDSMNLTCFSLPQRTTMLSYPEGNGGGSTSEPLASEGKR